MIKRILSIGMIMIFLFLSVLTVFAVEKKNGTTTVDNDKMIEYINSDSKKRLLLRNNYGYMTCIEKFNSDIAFLYLLNMSDLFINSGIKPDKTKYMEVLINIIASYDLDSSNNISKQKEMDNLKSFKDYALDYAEMGAQAISVMTGVSSSTTQLEEGISTAVDGLSVLVNNTDNWIKSLSNLETIVQNYSAHSEFLKLVAQKAEDSDLKDAANTLTESLSKAIKIKLDTYSSISNENFQNYEEFFFSDGLFAAIKQAPDYASDKSLKFFTECGEKVFVLKDSWDLGVSIGKMVGNVVVGGENLINRVLEMMALHDISDILVNGLFEIESHVVSNIYNNNPDGITNYINLSQYLIMSRIRGEYCLYSIVAEDAGLLSWFNKESPEDAKNWYDDKVKKLSTIQEELFAVIDTKNYGINAMDLIDKNLMEIVELMGNDYQLEKKDFSSAFGTDGGTYMIYNETTMPGFAVCPSYSSGIYKDIEDGVNARDKIRQGSYSYDGIAVVGNGKLNDTISADMTYNQIAEQIGAFDCRGVAQGTLVYSTEMNGIRVSFFFSSYDNPDLSARIKNNTVSSADMKSVNPKLKSIAVFKNDNSSANNNTVTGENWKKMYIEYINSLKTSTYSKFCLMDLDGNSIPELLYNSGFIAYGGTLSSYYQENINTVSIGSGSAQYINNRVYFSRGRMGYYSEKVFEVSNQSIECVFDGTKTAKSQNFDMNNSNDFNYSIRENPSNDPITVSYSEYSNKLSNLFHIDQSNTINYQYDYSNIVSAIREY